jgi:hypothetical protein
VGSSSGASLPPRRVDVGPSPAGRRAGTRKRRSGPASRRASNTAVVSLSLVASQALILTGAGVQEENEALIGAPALFSTHPIAESLNSRKPPLRIVQPYALGPGLCALLPRSSTPTSRHLDTPPHKNSLGGLLLHRIEAMAGLQNPTSVCVKRQRILKGEAWAARA